MNRQKILRISKTIRKEIVRLIKEKQIYWSDAKTLEGMCAIASSHLFKALKKEKIQSTICYNEWHCFLRIENVVLDITASQFDKRLPKILLCDRYDSRLDKKWHIQRAFNSVSKLQKFQKQNGWVDDQIHIKF